MTVQNPPGFLQNAGATHTAEQMRNHFGGLLAASLPANNLVPRGGVSPSRGNLLQVIQTGSPSMAVLVRSGVGYVPGTEGSKQGVYIVMNDADLTVSIAAAHATLARIDLIVFKVEDTAYSGAVNASSIVAITGTPAGSPSIPTAPNNSIILAQISVVALDTSITNGEITDRRQYTAGAGGLVTVANVAERDAITSGLYDGFPVWLRDQDAINVFNGSTWNWFARPTNNVLTAAGTTASGSYADLSGGGVGPVVTVATGSAAWVGISALATNATGGAVNFASVAVSGASTVASSDDHAVSLLSGYRAGVTHLFTGLTPGNNTFTMQYKVSAGTATVLSRELIVTPC